MGGRLGRAGRAGDGLFRILPEVPAGDHLITVAVRDAAGNTTSSRRHLRFDNEPPVLTEPVWPTIEKKTNSPVSRARRSDNLKLKLEIAINGETVKPTMTPTGFKARDAPARAGHADDRRPRHRPGRQHRLLSRKQLLVDSTEKL